MTRLELVLVVVTFALIVLGAVLEERGERRRRRKIRLARQRVLFGLHRQELALRGVMIAAVEARRAFEGARISGLFDEEQRR